MRNPRRSKPSGVFFQLKRVLSRKYSFVSFATTPDRANRATKLGIAIRPLKVSAKSQARLNSASTLLQVEQRVLNNKVQICLHRNGHTFRGIGDGEIPIVDKFHSNGGHTILVPKAALDVFV